MQSHQVQVKFLATDLSLSEDEPVEPEADGACAAGTHVKMDTPTIQFK